MNRRILIVAASLAAALGAGWIGSAYYFSQKTEHAYQSRLDELLARSPGLTVAERRYERGLFSAHTRIVISLPQTAARDGSPAQVLQVVFDDQIRHGPFPGGPSLAAAQVRSTVQLRLPSGSSRELTLLTADTRFDFQNRFQSRLGMPAGQWKSDSGDVEARWSAMEGEAEGRADTLATRYRANWPEFVLRVVEAGNKGQLDLTLRTMASQGHTDTLRSLWFAPGEVRSTLASLHMVMKAPQAEAVDVELTGLSHEGRVTLNGELIDMRSGFNGQGRVGKTRLDRVEMVEHWRRLHAPTIEKLIEKVLGELATGTAVDPERQQAQLLASLKSLLPHDPEYQLEKLSATIDGETGTLSWQAGIQGAAADQADNPLRLAGLANARIDLRLPQKWLALAASAGEATASGLPAGALEDMLAQGEQMGFLKVADGVVSANANWVRGRLDVNGRTVFAMPGQQRPAR